MRSFRTLCVVVSFAVSPFAFAADGAAKPSSSSSEAAQPASCEHGVKKSLCARCNPKLEAVFKAKGDWCPEHARPESQCVLCNPELAKKGVK